jgi:molybdate transport system substrate-binding protein
VNRIWLKSAVLLGAVVAGSLVLSACSSTSSTTSNPSGPGSPASSAPAAGSSGSASPASSAGTKVTGTLKVDAAASLKKTFDKLATEFQAENPGVKVTVSYDGSAVLATQLIGGAPVDVFASADAKNMTKVTDKKLITGSPVEFATNTLQIAVAPGNPKKITSLKDLTASGLAVDRCAVAQPCGAAAQTALKAAGVTLKPISFEQNVTAVLTKVESGDADAGLVYQTDVQGAAGKVTGVDFAEASKAVNHYPIAVLDAAPNPMAARAFIALVTGATGQKVLSAAGFGAPGV